MSTKAIRECGGDSQMNIAARGVVSALSAKFDVPPRYRYHLWNAICPIGVEIEVKWRHYFPALFQRYFVERKFAELTTEDREALNRECADLETELVPKLLQAEVCGVRRGADKYWEFAFVPSTDIYTTLNQIHILKQRGLIPPGEHSFHITIGGLDSSPDAYYLLMLLELLFCTKERIGAGFDTSNSKLSATWAKKGRAGLFVKESNDLQYEYAKAIELRVLTITDETDIEMLLKIVSTFADAIADHNRGIDSAVYEKWAVLKRHLKSQLHEKQLPDTNWNKPSTNPNVWEEFMAKFDLIRSDVSNALPAFFEGIPGLGTALAGAASNGKPQDMGFWPVMAATQQRPRQHAAQ